MPFNYGDNTGLCASRGWGLIWIAFGGCRGCDCTRHAPSIAAKATRAIWVITCGTILCLCACGAFWWVLCQWLSHRARAVKVPVRFLPPAWPLRQSEG